MRDDIKVGDIVKIFLKGESPWGIITDTDGDRIKVEIDNSLVATWLHGKQRGDEVWCELDEYGCWSVEWKNKIH